MAEQVAWIRAFPFITPDKIDDLPIGFYNHAREINQLFEASSIGVSAEVVEPGWNDIPLNNR